MAEKNQSTSTSFEVLARLSHHLVRGAAPALPELLHDLCGIVGAVAATLWVVRGETPTKLAHHGVDARLNVHGQKLAEVDAVRQAAAAGGTIGDRPPITGPVGLLMPDTHTLLLPLGNANREALGAMVLAFPKRPLRNVAVLLTIAGNMISTVVSNLQLGAVETEEARETGRLAQLGLLSASVAHEMRGPVGALSLLVPQLRQSAERVNVEDAQMGAIVDDIDASSKRLLGLCERMRHLSRRDESLETFEVAQAVADTLSLAKVHAQAAGVQITESYQPAVIRGLQSEIAQVVLNLVLNAIDACEDVPRGHGQVRVKVSTDKAAMILVVGDNGKGLNAGDASRIFEPFYTTKARGSGTGLGLSIVRKIVESHKGTITVAGRPDGGTQFTIAIPRVITERSVSGIRELAPVEAPAMGAGRKKAS